MIPEAEAIFEIKLQKRYLCMVAQIWRIPRRDPCMSEPRWETVSESIGLTLAEALIRETLNCEDVLQQPFVKANVSFRIVRFARLSSDSEAGFQFSLRCSSVEIAKMSSPSPGKRRMDTDVVKLYPLPIQTTVSTVTLCNYDVFRDVI